MNRLLGKLCECFSSMIDCPLLETILYILSLPSGVAVIRHSKKMIRFVYTTTVIARVSSVYQVSNFTCPILTIEEMQFRTKLGLDTWTDTGFTSSFLDSISELQIASY